MAIAGAAAAVGSLALAEVAARWGLRAHGGYYRYVPHRRQRIALDGEALPGLGPVIRVEINRDGERGGPPPRDDERAIRALVVGGSAAECIFLDQHETWPAVVERILNEPAHRRALGASRVHVGNAARAIVPCAEIHAMLRRMLPRYRKLDLVLVMVGASDVVSWMERGAPASLPEETRDPSKLFEVHPEGPWGWAPKQTALWRLARGVQRRLLRPVEAREGGGDWLRRARRMRAEAPHILDEEPDTRAMLDHFARHLDGLLRTAAAKAGRVILVRQPWLGAALGPEEERLLWNFGLGRPYREEVSTYFSARVVDAIMRRIDERAAAVARAAGVEQVDLLPRIERSARMFYDELHFTREGAEVVGRVVAEAVLRRG
jgi:lysophospholipase L1-like esterase